jgi:hypothetical protein|eukprot:m.133849 g.133849  ORF g.133849 m.133849 type:complete len:54 (+) comp22502_c0_seq1:301-462(+)
MHRHTKSVAIDISLDTTDRLTNIIAYSISDSNTVTAANVSAHGTTNMHWLRCT